MIVKRFLPQEKRLLVFKLSQEIIFGARGGTRTHNPIKEPHFECGAYANFATRAYLYGILY